VGFYGCVSALGAVVERILELYREILSEFYISVLNYSPERYVRSTDEKDKIVIKVSGKHIICSTNNTLYDPSL